MVTDPAMLGNGIVALIIIVGIWEAIWKAIALWKSARNSQITWFIVMVIFNTAGILPILYIFLFQKKKRQTPKIATKKPIIKKPIKKKK